MNEYKEALNRLASHLRATRTDYDPKEDYEKLRGLIEKYEATRWVKIVPCKCGCKRVHSSVEWTSWNRKRYTLTCRKCGRQVVGDGERRARRKWNETMSQE